MNSLRVVTLFLFVLVGVSQGALTLDINTAEKTFNITGSASGSSTTILSWEDGNVTGDLDEFISLADAFNESFDLFYDMGFYDTGGVDIFLNDLDSFSSVSGTGTDISYSSLSSANQTRLEGLIGETLTLSNGSGFDDMTVVPEPATISFLSISGLLIMAYRRFFSRL